MMFFKFSFILAILAIASFFFLSATALPVPASASAPGSLLGRSYSQRAPAAVNDARSSVVDSSASVVLAREVPLSMKRSERLQRRSSSSSSSLNRLARMANEEEEEGETLVARAPQPHADRVEARDLNVIRLIAARTDSNALH